MSNYALPKSHQDVSFPASRWTMDDTDSRQLMEKSLVDTDNEVAQIMVRLRSALLVHVTLC